MRKVLSWMDRMDYAILILFSPVIFPVHVLEESFGFVDWFNRLVVVQEREISQALFYSANVGAFVVTAILAFFTCRIKKKSVALLTLGWLSFLLLANFLFHLFGTIAAEYSPGMVTATILYLPFFLWYLRLVAKQFHPHPVTVATVVATGAIPMLVHGYLIVCKGTTLF